MVTTEQMQATKTYGKLHDSIAKKLAANKINRERITHGLNVSKNRSFDYWVQTFAPTETNQKIVKELLTN